MVDPPTWPGPRRLQDFVGQRRTVDALILLLNQAKRRRQPLPHLVFCGAPEMGKATLGGHILANELGTGFQSVSAKCLNRPADTMPYLTNAPEGSLILIEDIEELEKPALDFLLPAIADFAVDVVLGEGGSARTITFTFKRFTLVGTTSRPSRLDSQLRRSAIVLDFAPYTQEELAEIVRLLSDQHGLDIDAAARSLLAAHSNGTPGQALTLVKRLRDCFGEQHRVHIGLEPTWQVLDAFGYSRADTTSSALADRLRGMTGTEFEEYVADLFRRLGFSAETTPATGDHGLDLILRKGNEMSVAQCKCWAQPIGEPVVREFYGALVGAGAATGYLVATSSFTSAALTFAQGKPLKLIDLDALILMALTCGAEKLGADEHWSLKG